MKLTYVFHTLLVLMVASAFAVMVSDFRENARLKQRHLSGYKSDMEAMSFVARVNDLRVKMPGKSLEILIRSVDPHLPEGFILRAVTASERSKFAWLQESDFLVEQTAPPYLVIPSAGYFLHINLQDPNEHTGLPIELNPPRGTDGSKAP